MAVSLFGLHKNRQAKTQETDHLFARIFDRDLTDILLFILLAQMFARGKRNERKRDNNDYEDGGRVIIASSPNYGY